MNHLLDRHQQRTLLVSARATLAAALGRSFDGAGEIRDPVLLAPGASFVTLTMKGDLRGCIGSLEARRSLLDDVRSNARSAAFDDPRFGPVRAEELHHLTIEISHLSPLERVHVASERDAIAQLRPGIDGVMVRHRGRRGTLLPQVWDDLADRGEFLAHVKRKAGLPAAFWDEHIELYRYTVAHWSEADSHLRDAANEVMP